MNYIGKYIREHIYAVLIGVLGFLSAIVTMFINTQELVSIKWLIFVVFIALVVFVLFVSLIFELLKNNSSHENLNRLKLKYLNRTTDKGEVYLNQSLIKFTYGDVVKIYYLDKDKIENFIGIGVIAHIQSEQDICHIEFISKKEVDEEISDVYFSLKINKDELISLTKESE